MTTGADRTNFADKRNLPQQRIKDTFFDYLANRLSDLTYRAWGSQRGVFGTATLTGGVDLINVGVLPVSLLDGDGNVLVVDGANGGPLSLENALGITYYVGAKHVLIPSGVERNPRNDVINYDVWTDEIGETGDPNSIAEAAGQLTIGVDNVFEGGVSHAGRLVTVYLKQPVSDVEAVAIERNVVVTWSGTNNEILTSALLGQAGGSASTLPGDYTVVAQGVTIRRGTDLSVTAPYAFLGTATGAGAGGVPTTSVIGQIDITSGIQNNLDESYDASASQAKIITVDDGAFMLEGSSGSGDGQNAIFRVSRMGSTDDMQFGVSIQIGDDAAIPFVILQPVHRPAGPIEAQESVDQTAPDILTFTRGAVDLTDAGPRIDPAMHVVLLETGPEAGTLYVIKSIPSASTLQLMGLQSSGVPVPWTVGVGRTARILVPKVIFANPAVHAYLGGTTLDFWKGELHVMRDGFGTPAPIRYNPDGATPVTGKAIEWYGTIGTLPYIHSYLTNEGRWQIGQPSLPAGLAVITNAAGDAHNRAVSIGPRGFNDAQDLPSHRVIGHLNDGGNEYERRGPWGNRMRSIRRYANFIESTKPSCTVEVFNGGGSIGYGSFTPNATHGGAAHIGTGALAGNNSSLEFPAVWVPINTTIAIERVICCRFRIRQDDLADKVVKVGFKATGLAFFRFESTVNGGRWEFRDDDGGGGEVAIDTGIAAVAGTPNADDGWQDMWLKLDFQLDKITYWITGMATVGTTTFENLPTGWQDVFGRPYAFVETKINAIAGLAVGEMECWDEQVLGGPEE